MATLDRLRDIVKAHRSAVPVVDPGASSGQPATESREPTAERRAPNFLGLPEYTRAAIALGGAVVERPEGSVIVVDREYRADMLHGRMPIGDIVSTIVEGGDAMQLMARAWPS